MRSLLLNANINAYCTLKLSEAVRPMLRRLRADRPSARLVAFLICAAGALLLAHGHVKTDTFYSATYRESTGAAELPKPHRLSLRAEDYSLSADAAPQRVRVAEAPAKHRTVAREKGMDAQIEEVKARLADLPADHESEKIILERWLLDHARRGPGDEVQSAPSYTSRETPAAARADQPDPYHEPMKPLARPGETYHEINLLRGTGTKNSLEHHRVQYAENRRWEDGAAMSEGSV
jgi:hypothetical protein